jgi:hypothetical protein
MAMSGLINIFSTSGPYAWRARIVFRNREDERLNVRAAWLDPDRESSPLVIRDIVTQLSDI